jgi:hypothetical protein
VRGGKARHTGHRQGVIRMSAEEKKKHEHVTSPAHIAAAKSAASQRRHQLESNTLVTQWNKLKDTFKDGPPRSTWIVGGIVVGAVVLYFIWSYFKTSSDEKNSARWVAAQRLFEGESLTPSPDDKTLPGSEADFDRFAKANEGTTQARVVRFFLARMAMTRGMSRISSSRDAALLEIQKAAVLFEKLQGESSDDPILHIQSILFAAKAREMLGDFSKAFEYYNRLEKEYPHSAFIDVAKAGQKRVAEGSAWRVEHETLFKAKGG